MGIALGHELGLDHDKIDAVADWRASTALNDIEKLVIEFAEAITKTPAFVDENLSERLDVAFSPKQRVELAHAVAWENARARFNRTFGIDPDCYVEV